MQTVYEIIEQIASTSSTNEKKSILEANKDNELLKKVFYYAYNPRFNYWIKAKTLNREGVVELSHTDFVVLDMLIKRDVTGDRAREVINTLLSTLNFEAQEILVRIINHDLRCGASDTLAMKVWKNLVPEYPVLLCDKMKAKTEAYLSKFENNVGFWVELKEDGGRLITEVDQDGTVKYRSRNGNTLNLFGVFDDQLSQHAGMVFDGELVIIQDDGKPNRKLGNGFYTKAVRNTLTEVEAKQFTYKLWDCVPMSEYATSGKVPYSDRREFIEHCDFTGNIGQVYGKKVNTLAECIAFYDEMREDGQEGAIIKVANAVWEDTRSKNYVKLKAEETADLVVVGVLEGSGKYKGMIGSLLCETSDGLLQTGVGTGLNDDDRMKDPSYYMNSIVEVCYNEVISSKGKSIKSLFLPVYKQVRFDKSSANALGELK